MGAGGDLVVDVAIAVGLCSSAIREFLADSRYYTIRTTSASKEGRGGSRSWYDCRVDPDLIGQVVSSMDQLVVLLMLARSSGRPPRHRQMGCSYGTARPANKRPAGTTLRLARSGQSNSSSFRLCVRPGSVSGNPSRRKSMKHGTTSSRMIPSSHHDNPPFATTTTTTTGLFYVRA